MDNFIVFTGGPGSGKTTVINELTSSGYTCSTEVGRTVIQQQIEMGGAALPWADKTAFRDAMVREEVSNYQRHQSRQRPVFFDRSIIDSYGYSRLEGLDIPCDLTAHCKELAYCRDVFIFPPWEAIFTNDRERKQDFGEAVATYDEMAKAYRQFGYRLIEVPKTSVGERVDFILTAIRNR